ncbi:MAG: DUF4290 domain-containing protein [Bacteroidia bacterium]|nr:DUF4290 domain-containing protein [Bacteroidia bacterium]MCZ2276824.1 DUF4290 domain-containing protein [Bacteroidia bacterium]
MEYNSQRQPLIISEYGRIIQKMINHAVTIEDRESRNKAARTIVSIMGSLNPHLRDVADFKHKLWDHLFIMSGYKLDVDSPYPKPLPREGRIKPKPVPYPHHEIKYKYYGKTLETMIEHISNMEEGEKKDALVQGIANFMKFQYLSWNKDSVEDNVIFDHLKELSGNKITIREDLKLSQNLSITNRNSGTFGSSKKKKKKKKRHFNNN